MDLQTFNQFLGGAVHAGASDIHFQVGSPPAIRVNGELRPVRLPALAPSDTARIAEHVLSFSRYGGDRAKVHEVDTSYAIDGVGRFRASVFRQLGHMALIVRAIPFHVPTLEQLGLPAAVAKLCAEDRGLILVTGVTGSGKTSTLAAMVNQLNQTTRKHIVTIEDPVEFVHADQSARITQREVGPDTATFADALRAALRQDPDVILVGEMRDLETIDIALKAAETGHLVLSTTHTTDAQRTIGRMIGAYSPDAQAAVRLRVADALKGTIAQRLLPRADGRGRALACEILVNTASVVELIRNAQRTNEITDFLVKGHDIYGTQSFDQHLVWLARAGVITLDVAREAATNASDFQRAITLDA
ncbi:MAG: PilT/PilU family type 4a pilus ATPase [Deltaproteobacteria bacterium]|nr:PilT/PilU family type 4a pilus ATPase [Deltaproteobacteria bacterium]